MIQTLTRLFPLWAVLFSIFAFLFPGGLAQLSWAIVPLLMLIMFGMGMTLTWADFADVARRPAVIGLGVLLQFLVMPLVALAVGLLLALPPASSTCMGASWSRPRCGAGFRKASRANY